MKINIEIGDDSKFLEALSEEMKRARRSSPAGEQAETDDEADDFEIGRATPQKFSCVCVSCNG